MAPGAPPGLGAAPADDNNADMQREIATVIDAQVVSMLQAARVETEAKVKVELKQIIEAMMAMERQLDGLMVQLDAVDPQDGSAVAPSGAVTQDAVGQALQKVEQQWGQEIKTLKQELHQTILAHNHNADLIKHHKDSLDQLTEQAARAAGNKLDPAASKAKLQKVDQRLKEYIQKQKKMDPFFERLQLLEQCVYRAGQQSSYAGMLGAQAARMGAFPPAMPGMLGPPGMLGAGGLAGLGGLGGPPGMGLGAPGLGGAAPPPKKGFPSTVGPPGPKANAKSAFEAADGE